MLPNITFLGKTFSFYMLAALAGIFASGIYACRTAKKRTGNDIDMIILLLISVIGVFFGQHILFGITQGRTAWLLLTNLSLINSFEKFVAAVALVFGGSVFYGGLIGGLIAAFIHLRRTKADAALYSDMATPAIPLFHAFGRIGCFLSGCCYGIPSKVGFTYHYAIIEEANEISRFPVQLVEAAFNLGLFFVLYRLYKRRKFEGKLLPIYLISYSAARFCLEFLRGDEVRGHLLFLSTSQIIALVLIAASAAYLFISNKRRVRDKV